MSRCSACHASGLNTSVSIYWQSGHGKYSSIEARCWQLQTRWVIILQLAMHLEETISARLNHTEVEGRQFPGPCPCPLYRIWPTSDKSESQWRVLRLPQFQCYQCPRSHLTAHCAAPPAKMSEPGYWLSTECHCSSLGETGTICQPGSASPPLTTHWWPATMCAVAGALLLTTAMGPAINDSWQGSSDNFQCSSMVQANLCMLLYLMLSCFMCSIFRPRFIIHVTHWRHLWRVTN